MRIAMRTQPTHASIKALAHLTGGGFIENIPRVLPEERERRHPPGQLARSATVPLIQQRGRHIAAEEMYRVFNMGIGMVIVTAAEAAMAASCHRRRDLSHRRDRSRRWEGGAVSDSAVSNRTSRDSRRV